MHLAACGCRIQEKAPAAKAAKEATTIAKTEKEVEREIKEGVSKTEIKKEIEEEKPPAVTIYKDSKSILCVT